MKNQTILLIGFLILITLLFATGACDNTDDPIEDDQSLGKLTDADGNEYKTIKIGSQTWMAENLKTTKYNDGTKIPNVTVTNEWMSNGAYCNYDNKESYAASYGRLYNWYAVNTGKLAPTGWHVATDKDWKMLADYVKAKPGNSGTPAKALAATTNWGAFSDIGAIGNDLTKNNSTGFSALPGGYRHQGDFYDVGNAGIWWSSTVDMGYAWGFELYKYSSNVGGYLMGNGGYGFSVHCVRD